MKKIVLYSLITTLILTSAFCVVLKYNYEKDFLILQNVKINTLILHIDELNPQQKEEINHLASNYKYHIYAYNSIIFLCFATAFLLFFKRKKYFNID